MAMKRTQIYTTENQDEKLKRIAGKKGISKSELLRRILDDYLDKAETSE